ncbi:MAG: DUF3850 domain-containing protein [Candidatus Magasanikbacteria bacterium]
MKIEKKVHPKYFQLILDGVKKYELRLADFECGQGDILFLREWNSETGEYTGREIEKKVAMVMKTKDLEFWSDEEVEKFGYQVISFDSRSDK